MEFVKYMHVERYGNAEVDGINSGNCFIFPKIDGTNASLWFDGEKIQCGSRNRHISIDDDNQGFAAWVSEQTHFLPFFKEYPKYRLFGEWLVPHSVKTYTKDAWRNFYIFDVMYENEYLPYEIYKSMLERFGLTYIPAMCQIKNPPIENLERELLKNVFLIREGQGIGEGIVIKNYDFYNKFGRQVWAKMVSNQFKGQHWRAMKTPVINGAEVIEDKIASKFLDAGFIRKEYAKIVSSEGGWNQKLIPRLFNTVFYEFVKDYSWEIVKEFKKPKIDYKILYAIIVRTIKEEMQKEIF